MTRQEVYMNIITTAIRTNKNKLGWWEVIDTDQLLQTLPFTNLFNCLKELHNDNIIKFEDDYIHIIQDQE